MHLQVDLKSRRRARTEAEEHIARSYDLHANAYVTKPVDFDCFIEVVRQIDDFFVSVVKPPNRY